MEAVVGSARIVGPGDGAEGFLGSIGVRFMIDGAETAERFSLATRDRFLLYLPLQGADEASLAARLRELGALHTEKVVE